MQVTFRGDKPHGDPAPAGAHFTPDSVPHGLIRAAAPPRSGWPSGFLMATVPATFRADSQRIQRDNQALKQKLVDLDAVLEQVAGEDRRADELSHLAGALVALLPKHFRQEESALLAPVAKVSPELADFVHEMCRQHERLRARLAEFCRALDALDTGADPAAAARAVKTKGKLFAREMAEHIALEEHQLDGFL